MTHPAIRFTIYASLISYLFALVCWVSRRRGRNYRMLWSVSCVLMWGHALAAFHFYHHWSHRHAVELTAKETAEVLGEAYGEGIWFSYLLLVVWAADVTMCWIPKFQGSKLRPWLAAIVHLYVFFILFNGTVIFETGPLRWAGIIGTIWAVRMAWQFRSAPISRE